jgi:NADPH-dependent glutamate synthase beta subunit-like oxidoreductase
MMRPVRILEDASGRVEGVVCRRFTADPDGSKKQVRYFPIPGSDTCIDADLVIIAYERKPDLGCLLDGEDAGIGLKTTPASTLAADGITLLAADPDIFAAGDMHTGRATVVSAVAGGRMAARSIHYLITSGEIPVPDNLHRRVNPRSILKGITIAPGPPRVTLKELPVAVRSCSFTEEVVATLTDRQAHTEAQRCLQCGTCCYAHPNVLRPAGSPSG